MCIHIYIYRDTYIYICVCVYTYMSIYLSIYLSAYLYRCTYVYMYVWTCMCICMCIYLHTFGQCWVHLMPQHFQNLASIAVFCCVAPLTIQFRRAYKYGSWRRGEHVCIYIYTYVLCMYIYTCTHIYIYKLRRAQVTKYTTPRVYLPYRVG